MGVSPRKILATALGLAGFIYLVAPSQGQAPKSDPRVQGTNGTTTGKQAPATWQPKPGAPTVVGTIDLDFVFKNYDKYKASVKELGAAIQVRKAELMKYDEEARQTYEMMRKLNSNSEDYRKHENRMTELKAKMEAGKEQAEREITLRQAETMATLYKEVQSYAKWVAQNRGITHVMSTSNTPPTGSDPNSVMAAISRPVIFAEPANDITDDVVFHLNRMYKQITDPMSKAGTARQPHAGTGAATTGNQ